MKANKVDLNLCLEWVELLHQMLKQVMHMYTAHLKTDLDQTGHETVNDRKTQRVSLFNQALVISRWIDTFDTGQLKDFYRKDD